MLRIALPNKGSLAEPAADILAEAGYRGRHHSKELSVLDSANGVELYYLRPRDIATYVGAGQLDLGITGRDLLVESGAKLEEVLELGFARSTFRFAGPVGQFASVEDLAGKRIATSFTWLVTAHLADAGINATPVKLDGAVEVAIQLGVADAIADVVETGTTLKEAGLSVFGDPIMTSEAVLVARPDFPLTEDPRADQFVRRLRGVLVARRWVMVEYNVQRHLLDQATAITPGRESPTVTSLKDEHWLSVRAMIDRNEIHNVMDRLEQLGARTILVTEIHACRM
jgi:ATP phosphoribosyltransferase